MFNRKVFGSTEGNLFASFLLIYVVSWLRMTISVPRRPPPNNSLNRNLADKKIESNIHEDLISVGISPNEEPVKKNDEYCVSWDTNTDKWWTRNPDWGISQENDTHYCFRRLEPEKAALMKSIYETQFPSNCSSTITKTMWNSGWGADLSNVVDGLKFAHQTRQRPFSVYTSPDTGWHYASKKDGSKPVCPERTMQCYFLNMTSCPPNNSRRASYDRQSFLTGNWNGFHQARDYLEFSIRPQTWLRKEVYKFSKPYAQRLSTPCTVLHVRRGDVVLLDPRPRRYHAISEYMNEHNNVSRSVLLLTDDHNAIGEAIHDFPDHDWVYINRTRYKGAEGGWENHIPSDDPKQEVVVLLSLLRLTRKCNKLIQSKSNLADYMYSEMKAAHTEVAKINLDQGQGDKVHNERNTLSVSISKTY